MSKLSLIKRNKNNHFRKKSTLRRRNTRRKYSSKKSKSKKGGGTGASSRLQEYRLKSWNPKIFFKTIYTVNTDCTKLVTPDRAWKLMMYNSLIHFFDNFPDTILQKPMDIDRIKETYLDFYKDKTEWLVKQYCIFMNSNTSQYTTKPTERDSETVKNYQSPEIVKFFSWLTNLEYIDPAKTRERNEFWLNITAPNPDEYDYPASSRHSTGGVKDPLLASSADFLDD